MCFTDRELYVIMLDVDSRRSALMRYIKFPPPEMPDTVIAEYTKEYKEHIALVEKIRRMRHV